MKAEHNNDGCLSDEMGNRHEYADKKCEKCQAVYCWTCCGQTNVHEGGKHVEDFMLCPVCGHDYYEELEA